MTKNYLGPALICGFLVFSSCNQQPNGTEFKEGAGNVALNDSAVITGGGIPIFYNMYLSVEMNTLLKNIHATFNQNLLNPYQKADEYDLSGKKAVNLGIYAVDLSYSKVFDQVGYAGNYLKTMHKLATDLGIPEEDFYISVKRIEKNASDKDSLVKIANQLYTATESYLKETDRAAAAALVILGGWTEALYLATNMVDKQQNDIEFLERIADQKTSLRNLIRLLENYKNDKNVSPYLQMLNRLVTPFDAFVVDEKNMGATYGQLSRITSSIRELRLEIVK